MKIKTMSVEKSFTLSLQEGYRKVTVMMEADVESDEDKVKAYQELSEFITERMKEEKAKFTK